MGDQIIDGSGMRFERICCGGCGIEFYVPQTWVENRRDKGECGGKFHCPNGHSRFWKESTLDKIRRERDRLKQTLAQKDDEILAERRRTAAARGIATKLQKRAAAGVCPCCNRSFENMARHMATKHPDFKTAEIIPLEAKAAS